MLILSFEMLFPFEDLAVCATGLFNFTKPKQRPIARKPVPVGGFPLTLPSLRGPEDSSM